MSSAEFVGVVPAVEAPVYTVPLELVFVERRYVVEFSLTVLWRLAVLLKSARLESFAEVDVVLGLSG